MRIAVGSDEATHLTRAVIAELEKRGHQIELYGALGEGPSLWPKVAQAVAERVAAGACQQGVLFCWTGTGVSIAANKVPGIRAALCHDTETARGARRWNNANVLVMSLRATPEAVAKEIVDGWFASTFSQEAEDQEALAAVKSLEEKYSQSAIETKS
jgi:ribose 5-phosphate isomerase B